MKRRIPKIAAWALDNWTYKLVALVVALAVWITMLHGRKDAILIRSMDIQLITSPRFIVMDMPDKYVQVKVVGPRNLLKKWSQSSSILTLNLLEAGVGQRKIEIKPNDINLPLGIKLISVVPNEFMVSIKEVKN